MNSPPLTTVELLQRQRYPQTTMASLKRSTQELQHTSTEHIQNSSRYPLGAIQTNAFPRKRYIYDTFNTTTRGENDPINVPRPIPSAAYPTPPPSTSEYSTEAIERVWVRLGHSGTVMECSLVDFHSTFADCSVIPSGNCPRVS